MRRKPSAEAIVQWAEDQADTQPLRPTSKSTRLSVADIKAIASLASEGYKQVEIAQIVGCSQATVSNTLKELKTDAEALRILLRPLVEESIEDWREARKVAALRGDHRPARELVELAHTELRSQGGSGAGGGGVTVVIGMPGQPAALPDITINASSSTLSPSVSGDLHRLTGDS